ncbi:MAG TPA: hypothetical protein VD788_05520 [Candidatus Polarisedimenticolaceae bacterium]|nr:hypothetical protein [Candidatus Polarisedimenticolaceae bacterium]
MRRTNGLACAALVAAAGLAAAGERSRPIDCLPDRLAAWQAAEPDPETRFGALSLPGIVLGPPGDSVAYQGSVTVASLGFGGRAVYAFDDLSIEDRPGPDFVVFENGFFALPLPAAEEDEFLIFAEPGLVEVSLDGVDWRSFPYDAQALVDSIALGGSIDRGLYLRMVGLAGLTPTFTGNWTVPDDPAVFDPAGTAGVSGAGGDAFDLADVGLPSARFVRITDAGTGAGFAGSAEGFDLDALVVLHGRPGPAPGVDQDHDGLSDAEEAVRYGSDPALADSDGDGVDDGREVASCRDPASTSTAPWIVLEPALWLAGSTCTEARWTFVGSSVSYDLVRADGDAIGAVAGQVDLGSTTCLADSPLGVRWSCDAETPLPGDWFGYLVRVGGATDWGRSSALEPRGTAQECP